MFIDIREPKEREVFIDELFEVIEGVHFKEEQNKDLNFTREDIINSNYSIVIDVEKLEVDYLRTTTSAAAAISSKEKFVTPKVALCILITLQSPIKYESDVVMDDGHLWNMHGQKEEITFLDFDDEDYAKAEEYIKELE